MEYYLVILRTMIFIASLFMFYLSYVASLAAGQSNVVWGLILYITALCLFSFAGLMMAKATNATHRRQRKPSGAFATPGFYHSAGNI